MADVTARTRREDAEEQRRLVSPCCAMPSRRGGFEVGPSYPRRPRCIGTADGFMAFQAGEAEGGNGRGDGGRGPGGRSEARGGWAGAGVSAGEAFQRWPLH